MFDAYKKLLFVVGLLVLTFSAHADRLYIGNYDLASHGFNSGGQLRHNFNASTNTHEIYVLGTGSEVENLSDSAIGAALSAGENVLIYSTDEVIIFGDIYKSAGSDTARLTIRANHAIEMEGVEIKCTSSGALDVILWSDYDEVWDNGSSGDSYWNTGWGEPHFIFLHDGANIITNGGVIALGGGRDDGGITGTVAGDGIPDGFAYNGEGRAGERYPFMPASTGYYDDDIGGVQLGPRGTTGTAGINLISNGGRIELRGRTGGDGVNGYNSNPGIGMQAKVKIDAGAGQIYMRPEARTYHAFYTDFGTSPDLVIRSSSDAVPAIEISARAFGSSYDGIYMGNSTTGSVLFQSESTTGGGMLLTGISSASNGLQLGPPSASDNDVQIKLYSAAGDIVLYSTTSTATDMQVNSNLFLGADTASSPVAIQGIVPITSSVADVRIEANDYNLSMSGVDKTIVKTEGKLIIDPPTTGTNWYVNWGLTGLSADVSEIVVGDDAGPANGQPSIYFNEAVTVENPLTLYGDFIQIYNTGAITLTGAGDALNLLSQSYIRGTIDVSLSTNGGDITLATDIEDGRNGDYIVFDRGLDIQSNGGNITLGGEDITASGYARGSSDNSFAHPTEPSDQLTFANGIVLDGDVDILSGGGDITLRGKSLNTSSNIEDGWGIGSNTKSTTKTFNSGTGKIYIEGVSETISAVDRAMGQYWAGNLEILSASTASDAIQLIATVLGTGDNDFGFEFNDDGDANDYLHIYATGVGGGILIQGDAGPARDLDIFFNSQAQILANGGPIVIEGKSTRSTGAVSVGSGNTLTLAAAASAPITSSSSNVTLRGDSFSAGSKAIKVNTSGNLTWEPSTVSASFGNLTSGVVDLNPFSGTITDLTIGKDGNSGDITLIDTITVDGDVNLYGRAILLDQPLTVGQNLNIETASAGSVAQNATLTADAISISGTGSVTLTNAANDVNTFAAGGVGLTTVAYTDADGFTVGTAGLLSGISCSGLINLQSLTGDITIANNISTGSNSNQAVTINADSDESAGNDGSGNIIISGTPTISVPNGQVYFFTGTQAGSTGLMSLVGGTNNAVNNADETNYIAAMDTAGIMPTAGQMYAIYRQTAALPVEFMYFRVACDGLQAQLDWATAMEDNNAHFEVERSQDGYEWTTIGMVQGAGTSLTEQHYEYIDLTPAAGLRYYRLRQVDYNGAYEYSPIISVSCKSGNTVSEPFLYPNPAYDVTTIVVPSAMGLLQVRNALGQLVHEQNILGTHTILSVAKFQAGLYYITIQEGATRRTLPLLVD